MKARIPAIQKENKKQAILDDLRAGLLTIAQIPTSKGVNYHMVYAAEHGWRRAGLARFDHRSYKATQEVVVALTHRR
ncbi:MAG: hypothetical protein U5N53_22945 [Mycobacterium sp.]|nr:hypothetical protein [Mycobacterium sp.]